MRVAFSVLALASASAVAITATGSALAFGTVNLLGQSAEHERITRAALGCRYLKKRTLCFQEKSLSEIAGKRGTFGAVGAPDNPANRDTAPTSHCDNSKLKGCRAQMRYYMKRAVKDAGALLDRQGRIRDSQIPTIISCTYLYKSRGRAKCNVLEQLGRVLHAAQDFYAHSNWADEADRRIPVSGANPRGLNRRKIAPFLNLRRNAKLPPGLVSGCFMSGGITDTKGDALCKARKMTPTHFDLNKDKGAIRPGRLGKSNDPTLTGARTRRGRIGRNFHNAVRLAVSDTRDKMRYFRELLIKTYGRRKGRRMYCAIAHDDPVSTCR